MRLLIFCLALVSSILCAENMPATQLKKAEPRSASPHFRTKVYEVHQLNPDGSFSIVREAVAVPITDPISYDSKNRVVYDGCQLPTPAQAAQSAANRIAKYGMGARPQGGVLTTEGHLFYGFGSGSWSHPKTGEGQGRSYADKKARNLKGITYRVQLYRGPTTYNGSTPHRNRRWRYNKR